MKRSVGAGKPFYAYVPFTLVHFPTLPNPTVAGKTGNGDFPDALAEMDAHVGEIVDAVDDLGIAGNTIVVFTSDNGPEATWPWQGSSGPWRGYYFTHMEGSLRVPFIVRWPHHIPAERVSNEIVHEVDTFHTFASIAGASVPTDRPIDGVDQTDFLLGKSERSSREGFPVFVADRLEAVKWRNWKIAFYDEERDWWTVPAKLGTPKAFDLITDPKEEYPADSPPEYVECGSGDQNHRRVRAEHQAIPTDSIRHAGPLSAVAGNSMMVQQAAQARGA